MSGTREGRTRCNVVCRTAIIATQHKRLLVVFYADCRTALYGARKVISLYSIDRVTQQHDTAITRSRICHISKASGQVLAFDKLLVVGVSRNAIDTPYRSITKLYPY